MNRILSRVDGRISNYHVTNRVKEAPKKPPVVFIRGGIAHAQCNRVGKQIEPVLEDELRPLGASIAVPWLARVVPGSRSAWLIPTNFGGLCGTGGPSYSRVVSNLSKQRPRRSAGETSFRECSVHKAESYCSGVCTKCQSYHTTCMPQKKSKGRLLTFRYRLLSMPRTNLQSNMSP